MITINLRPDAKRGTKPSPFAAVKERAAAMRAGTRNPAAIAATVAWIAVAGWLGWSFSTTQTALAEVEPKLDQARAEHRRFATFLKQKQRQELIRDSLVKQIGVIRTVDGDRYVWPHIMDEVARAVPAYTWLMDIAQTGGAGAPAPAPGTAPAAAVEDSTAQEQVAQFQINGRTVDIQAYTRFLRQLEASPWITNVTPVSAQTVIEKERPVTAFTVRASFRRADSAYIKTVPLAESVR